MVAPSPDTLDRVFAALAHPIRREVLTRLAREGSASVSELAEPFDVTLMAVSKHLKVLDEAGLVRRERDGRVRRCTFDPEPLAATRDWIERHRHYWERRLDALAAYLEETDRADGPEPPHEEKRS